MKWGSRWSRTIAGDLFSCSQPSGNMPATVNYSNPMRSGSQAILPPVESDSRVSSMTIADVSPRLAVKKVCAAYRSVINNY